MPKKPVKPKMAPISRILDKKPGGENEILYPTPTPFVWNGTTYKIRPLTNKAMKNLSGEFEGVIDIVTRAAESQIVQVGDDGKPVIKEIDAQAILPFVPAILDILLPSAVCIIADSLRVDEEMVEDEMFLPQRVEALRLIVEANDLPLLIANFRRLVEPFIPPKATKTAAEMNADGEVDEEATDDETEMETSWDD